MIELVVVIVILGILSLAGARPLLNTYRNESGASATRAVLKSDLQFARLQALQTGLAHQIEFTSSTTYTIQQENGSNWVTLTNWHFTPLPATNITLSTSLTHNTLIFDRLGRPFEDPASDTPQELTDPLSSNETITLTLPGNAFTITINQNTGVLQ